jgi:hypothetical protein
MHCLNLIAFAAVAARRALRGSLPRSAWSGRVSLLQGNYTMAPPPWTGTVPPTDSQLSTSIEEVRYETNQVRDGSTIPNINSNIM